jgi:hypothetical protein
LTNDAPLLPDVNTRIQEQVPCQTGNTVDDYENRSLIQDIPHTGDGEIRTD